MVSIVIVSHSRQLADGVYALASQMSQGKVQIAVAAGIDDPENPIGTDPIAVMTAVENVYSPDGVLILVDMGSAILSTDMALELMDEKQASVVKVCAAPLVEGAVVACVSAAAGMSMDQVLRETHEAIIAKYETLNQADFLPFSSTQVNSETSDPETESENQFFWEVQNPHGIHARPASAIVTTACQFDADMWLIKDNKKVNAKSINKVALLGIKQHDTLTCITEGVNARQALEAFIVLAQSHFGEDITEMTNSSKVPKQPDKTPTTLVTDENGALSGIAASDGITIAPAMKFRITMPEYPLRPFITASEEVRRLYVAIRQAHVDLDDLISKMSDNISENDTNIFKAHQHMLSDPDLTEKVQKIVMEEQMIIEQAWTTVIEATADAYKSSEDSYLVERANDIYDIGRRVLLLLTKQTDHSMHVKEPVILFAHDLSPSDTAQLDPKMIKGLCLETGGSTSHCAILARSLGIPAVVGMPGVIALALDGKPVILDGAQGKVWLTPTPSQISDSQEKINTYQEKLEKERSESTLPAVTKDGKSIEVFANIASRQDAIQAVSRGAEGVGLLRSEFLFMNMPQAPTEDEQTEFYSDIATTFAGKEVIVRTLDIGGDKPLTYLQQSEEDNPFLGCRGIRLCLKHPDVFKVQLRALLRARAENDNLKIMFPMVSCLDELLEAKTLLKEAHKELLSKQVSSILPDVGIMIEVPAAVANAKALAKHADFFSIGTNDLTQYVMAADRGNESVAHLISTQQPAVLRMIKESIKAAHHEGIKIGICGEMAGDAKLTPYLIGLGIDELSMSSIRIAAVKSAVRATDDLQSEREANGLLNAATLNEVQAKIG